MYHMINGTHNTRLCRKCLVIGADALSRWVDWDDRNSCILFGDGAGAMVLEAAEGDDGAGLLGECFRPPARGSFNLYWYIHIS